MLRAMMLATKGYGEAVGYLGGDALIACVIDVRSLDPPFAATTIGKQAFAPTQPL